MAAIKFVWGYRAGLFVIASIWAGYAIANGTGDVVIPFVELVIGHR